MVDMTDGKPARSSIDPVSSDFASSTLARRHDMIRKMEEIGAILRLSRIQTAPLTGLAPVMGASLSGGFSPPRDLLLFCAGICCHIFGFVHNELRDRHVDRLASDLAGKPLVEGSVSPRAAAIVAIGALVVGFVLMATVSGKASLIVAGAVTAAYLYNRTSKSVPFADWAVALTMGLLVWAGGAAAGGANRMAWIVGGLLTLQLVVQNTLAHLKDLEQDQAAGGSNAALWLGVCRHGACILIPSPFQTYVTVLRFLHLGLAIWGVGMLPQGIRVPAALALVITQGGAIRSFRRLLSTPPASRSEFLEAFSRHELPTLFAVTILLIGALGWWALLPYVVLPLGWAWISLRLLHRGEMPAL